MTEKEKSLSSAGSSTRWSVPYRVTNSSQMDGPVTNEQLPLLASTSPRNRGSISTINSDPQDSYSSEGMLNESDSHSTSSFSSSLQTCGKDCLATCNVCRGISCKRMFYDRFPKGRAIATVLLINTLESFALFGAFDGLKERIIEPSNKRLAFLFVFFQWCAGRIFYPITGLIADTCLGRYRMINIGLWLMWTGFALITINENFIHARVGNHTIEKYILPCMAVVLLIVSSGSVEANIIPFGADQVQQGASSSELSSYFYYYYFSRTAGLLLGICLFLLIFDTNISLLPGSNVNSNTEHSFSFNMLHAAHPLFAVLAITIALIFHFCARRWYFKDRDYNNPLRLIINVLYYAATVKRQVARYRKAFRYGEERKPRIELAKIDYDGIFSSEEVEDVKTFFRIFLVIFSLGGNFLTFGMTVNILTYQITSTSSAVFGSEQVLLSHSFFQLLLFSVSLLSLLVVTHLFIPLFPGSRMRVKLGAGVLFTALSPAAAMIVQFSVNSRPLTHMLCLILPTIFLSIGDMSIYTAGLEFIYAQSPNSMKGLLTGLLFLWFGVFSGVGIIFFTLFPIEDDTKRIDTIGGYYALSTFVGAVSVAMYIAVACIYRNRERPTNNDGVEDDAVRRGMYGHVNTLHFPDMYSE